ncbi:MAG: Gfo/Idh/MocA family oxidoreductase [Gemmataceae bacterium]
MDTTPVAPSRRQVLEGAGTAAVAALAGVAIPAVHAGADSTIRLALVGCGGRGTGAVADALSVKGPPVKLVAMADVFEHRLNDSHKNLAGQYSERIEVPKERRFVGFDGYRNAMDCLRPGDVVILATPAGFRVTHFTQAVAKGLNVFMEKSLAVDAVNVRRLFDLAETATKKNLKVGVGLMCRHCKARHELHDRLRDGVAGDLRTLRAYRMHGPAGVVGPRPAGMSELLYQVQQFHGFLWAGTGFYVDWLIHNIDECCWMKDAWPVRAHGIGGRHFRGNAIDQNFDHYAVEYTFADGAKLFVGARGINGCHQEFASYADGTKGLAVISSAAHSPAKCRIYKGFEPRRDQLVWAFKGPEPNPYQLEWEHLLDAIRNDRPYNEVRRGAEANLVALMGRKATHTGRVVSWEEMLSDPTELAPGVDKLTADSPAPVQLGTDGRYPAPQPGALGTREY